MTDIYILDRSGAAPPVDAAALLPPWRRERYERLKNENARTESLWAGLLYACALRRRGLDPASPVEVLPAGKPVLRDVESAFFSLSHSGRYVLCAVGPLPVGADVQELRPVRRSIAGRLHPAERARLEALPAGEWEAAFFRVWTRKEAWVKAVSRERMLSLSEADVLAPLPGLHFRDFTLPGGFAAAVCAGEAAFSPLQWVDSGGLLEF